MAVFMGYYIQGNLRDGYYSFFFGQFCIPKTHLCNIYSVYICYPGIGVGAIFIVVGSNSTIVVVISSDSKLFVEVIV